MKVTIKALPAQALATAAKLKPYMSFAFVLLILGVSGFLVLRIRGFVVSEPSDEAVTQKLNTLQRPHIDQATLDKLQQLEDNSVQVKTLFKQARDNPFQE